MNETLKILLGLLDELRKYVNRLGEGYEPWEIILYTAVIVMSIAWINRKINTGPQSLKSIKVRIKEYFFFTLKRIPFIKKKIDIELSKNQKEMRSQQHMFNLPPGMSYNEYLPTHGLSEREIMNQADNYLTLNKVNWKKGLVSGGIYNGHDSINNLVTKVFSKFVWSNPLHPEIFPAVRKMEAEVVRMTCNIFNGHLKKSCGSVSSGGTESILLACKAYRTWANERGINYPEIVCPVTAHAAFEKAAGYFQMKIKQVPLNPFTYQVDIKEMEKAITKNTCLLVGSAPNFPHGIIDPIEKISKLGIKYNIPVHVDACLGGFLIAFMEDAGYPLPLFDFRLPGVTSISADTHKYAYTPKGTSCVLYSDKKWIHYQYFVCLEWPGGIYATPTFSGSRAGSLVAVCWATMMHFGHSGYVECTKKVIATSRYIIDGLKNLDGIFVIGDPKASVIAVASLDFDIYQIYSKLLLKGWNLNNLQHPPSFHLCCTMLHTKPGVADKFLADVECSIDEVRLMPKGKLRGTAALYGVAQAIPDKKLVAEMAAFYLDSLYEADNSLMSNGTDYCEKQK